MGGEWVRSKKRHVFAKDFDLRAHIINLLDEGGMLDEQKTYQVFETPPELAAIICELGGVSQFFRTRNSYSAVRILEPSAGSGNLIRAVMNVTNRAARRFTVYEIRNEPAEQLRQLLEGEAYNFDRADFLQVKPVQFDLVIMNPPFANGQEIEHVAHAMKFVSSPFDGQSMLLSVMSSAVLSNQQNKYKTFRSELKYYNHEFIELPRNSFKSSDTMVNTVLLKVLYFNP